MHSQSRMRESQCQGRVTSVSTQFAASLASVKVCKTLLYLLNFFFQMEDIHKSFFQEVSQ